MAVMFLDSVALKQPKSVIPYDKEIIDGMNSTDNAVTMFAGVLAKLCIDEVRNLYYFKNKQRHCTLLYSHGARKRGRGKSPKGEGGRIETRSVRERARARDREEWVVPLISPCRRNIYPI